MNTITKELQGELFKLQDKEYGDFHSRIVPDIPRENIIGVRMPLLKKLAAKYSKTDVSGFLTSLPHRYIEENNLHAEFINRIKDIDECLSALRKFLPYVDNWATCDMLAPKVFQKHKDAALKFSEECHSSSHTYTIRFGTAILMKWFLDDDFDVKYAERAAAVCSEEYYVNMMIAWYFATALAKQYDAILPFIEQHKLDKWTHNKAIQKAIESYRITPEQKDFLRSLKIK